MSGIDNIVWGMNGDDDSSWSSDAGNDNESFPDTAGEPLPSLDLEFGDVVPLRFPIRSLPSRRRALIMEKMPYQPEMDVQHRSAGSDRTRSSPLTGSNGLPILTGRRGDPARTAPL